MPRQSNKARVRDAAARSAQLCVGPVGRFRWGLLLCVCLAAPGLGSAQPLPLLDTSRQVRNLTRSQAVRGYPVRISRAHVILFQAQTGSLFVTDSTDSILVDVRGQLATYPSATFRPGDVVTVQGVTGAGETVAAVFHARAWVIGHAPVPDAPLINFKQAFSGAYDLRWVTVEGIVISVQRTDAPETSQPPDPGEQVGIQISSGPDQLDVSVPLPAGSEPSYLIDAKVRLRAIVRNQVNDRKVLTGVHLFMPDLASVQVMETAPAGPFALPLIPIAQISAIAENGLPHRVHIRGVVTSIWGDHNLSLTDTGHGIFVTTEDPADVHPGDLIDVAGFPVPGGYSIGVNAAMVRRIGSAPDPRPVHLTSAQALLGTHDADVVEIDGRLLERSHSPSGVSTLLLTDGQKSFLADVPPGVQGKFIERIQLGSLVRVRGVCAVHADAFKAPENFNILLRAPSDVLVLQSQTWWTPRRMLLMASLLCGIVLIVVFWNVVLRRQVRSQTRTIQSQLEEARRLRMEAEAATHEKSGAMANLLAVQHDLLNAQEELRHQATHDSLTGLCNRAALMGALNAEIERSRRTHSPLAILLLDLDHFKKVNDQHGHMVGDAVLKEVAQRLIGTTRPYDMAGRYGGEEFLIVLPDCGDFDTETTAERIRTAVAASPFRSGAMEIPLTVSIGATVAVDWMESDVALLDQADAALYHAKSCGRNCTVLEKALVERRVES